MRCKCRAEELKFRPQKLHTFLLRARACAADEGHRRLLARNATEFAACLRLREQVCSPLVDTFRLDQKGPLDQHSYCSLRTVMHASCIAQAYPCHVCNIVCCDSRCLAAGLQSLLCALGQSQGQESIDSPLLATGVRAQPPPPVQASGLGSVPEGGHEHTWHPVWPAAKAPQGQEEVRRPRPCARAP